MLRAAMIVWVILIVLTFPEGQSAGDMGDSWKDPHDLGETRLVPQDYPTIQDAIDAASDGDTVVVRAGTYYENLRFCGKTITVRSASGPESTIIDGGDLGRVVIFDEGEDDSSVIEGFTIQHGCADRGGGVYCDASSPTISNNRIIENHATASADANGDGGGIYCGDGSHARIVSNTIVDNTAQGSGGGICFVFSSPTIDRNLIMDNIGALGGGGAQGGGIAGYGGSVAAISNNLIIHNSAVMLGPGDFDVGGGGISLDNCGSDIVVVNNTLDRNTTVYGYGGGIFCDYDASPTIKNNIITNSLDGEGIWASSVGSFPLIDHNDVWRNADGDYGGTAQAGQGDISADPAFVDPRDDNYRRPLDTPDWNYHLKPGSPCIDKGDNGAEGLPSHDMDGDDRVVDGDDGGTPTVDMGADEFVPLVLDRVRPRRCEPGERIRLVGRGFGSTQGDSVLHIGKRVFDLDSPRIKLWSESKIKIRTPNRKCEWFRGQDFRRQKVWVTVHGIDSKKRRIKVIKPEICP
jgi:parallel beta-helix repeat protein